MERGPKDSKKNAYLYNQTVQSWLNSMWSFETELLWISAKNTTCGGFQPLFRSFMNFSKSNSASSSKASRSSQSQSSNTWWKYSGLLRGHMHGKCCYHCWRKRYSIQTIPPVPKKPQITGFSLFTASQLRSKKLPCSVWFQHSHKPPPSTKQAQTWWKLSHVSTSPVQVTLSISLEVMVPLPSTSKPRKAARARSFRSSMWWSMIAARNSV